MRLVGPGRRDDVLPLFDVPAGFAQFEGPPLRPVVRQPHPLRGIALHVLVPLTTMAIVTALL